MISIFSSSYVNMISCQDSELRTRVVDLIDVVKDQHQNFVEEEDPTVYVSEKTGRGPLQQDWVQDFSSACVVCTKCLLNMY